MIIKDSNLRSFIYGERYKILAGIIAIILALLIIQLFNSNAKRQNEEKSKNAQNLANLQTNAYNPGTTIISRK